MTRVLTVAEAEASRDAAAGGGSNAVSPAAPPCEFEDLGRLAYDEAWDRQRELVAKRKAGAISDRLLFVEHPPVITLGRNAKTENLLVTESRLKDLGVSLWETDRGGDITYHGPGQIVAYPILDLREWKRDVVAYVRSLEQVIIDAVAEFGIQAETVRGCTGVWVQGAKLAAIGVHISRWVTSHGFALNVSPDLRYFGYIIPCGINKPVTSIEKLLPRAPDPVEVRDALVRHFGEVFGRTMCPPAGAGSAVAHG